MSKPFSNRNKPIDPLFDHAMNILMIASSNRVKRAQ